MLARYRMRLLQLFVILQLTLLVERFVTSVTLVRVGSDVNRFLVRANRAFVIESLVTVGALVWLLTGVQSHMDGKPFFVVQHFVATFAFQRLPNLFVSPRMSNQVRLMVEALHTNLALVRFFTGM